MEIFLFTTVVLAISTAYYKGENERNYKQKCEYDELHLETMDVIREMYKKYEGRYREEGEKNHIGDIAENVGVWITDIKMKHNSNIIGFQIFQWDSENPSIDYLRLIPSERKQSE